MNRMFACTAMLALVCPFVTSSAAQAQFGPPIVHPSALQPGANVMIPGTGQLWQDPSGAIGFRYLGIDGRYHGVTNFVNPATGLPETHVYGRRNTPSVGPLSPVQPYSNGPSYRPSWRR